MASKSDRLRGRVWLLKDKSGAWHENVLVEQIFPSSFLSRTDPRQIAEATFADLPGWEDFYRRVQAGDILVTGREFGTGTVYRQAVTCFSHLGVALLLGHSFAPDYYREAVNHGMAVMRLPGLSTSTFSELQEVEINLVNGLVSSAVTGKRLIQGEPWSAIQMAIYRAGGLSSYANQVVNQKRAATVPY